MSVPMENQLQTFSYEKNKVRVVMKNGQPWFVAQDVCNALEIGDTHKAVDRLDDDERGRSLIPTLGGQQDMLTITESGLYTLTLGSRKPQKGSKKLPLKFQGQLKNVK